MATSTTAVAIPADGTWTLVYTAAGTLKAKVGNQSPTTSLRIRVGAAAVVGDAYTTGHFLLPPGARETFDSIVSGDKIYASPIGPDDGVCSVWA
jgi:hypothetical protein